MAKLDVKADGAIDFDQEFFLEFERDQRPHQIRLEGGDASSDSFCFS
jgi:selenium-binding protein 1